MRTTSRAAWNLPGSGYTRYWRVVFRFADGEVLDIDYVDYH